MKVRPRGVAPSFFARISFQGLYFRSLHKNIIPNDLFSMSYQSKDLNFRERLASAAPAKHRRELPQRIPGPLARPLERGRPSLNGFRSLLGARSAATLHVRGAKVNIYFTA